MGLEQALDRSIRRRRQKQLLRHHETSIIDTILPTAESPAERRRRDLLSALKTALRWLITFTILETTAAVWFFPVLLDPGMVGALKISLETPLPVPGSLA